MKPFCLGTVLFLVMSMSAYGQPPKSTAVSVCELADGWKLYNGQEITSRAIYSEETVQEQLQDPKCPKLRVAVEWPPHIPANMKQALSKLNALVARDSHNSAQVAVRGVFHGPVPYDDGDIPSNLPPKMKERMRHGHRGYGYMGAYDYVLKVTEISEAKAVSTNKSQ